MVVATLLRDKHVSFIHRLYELPPTSLESLMTQHIRINGIYWALIALHLLDKPNLLPRGQLIEEIKACRHSSGGYGSAPGHDPHVVCTLHAIQILTLVEAIDEIDVAGTVAWIASLQVPSGAVRGDKWGEIDMRINYAATQALALVHRLDALDTHALQRYVLGCRNFDGGFGMVPGGESHAAHAFTSLGTLSLLARHHGTTLPTLVDVDQVAWWLSLRQVKSGGLNGRPEKLEDVCYSWYVLSSLAMLGRTAWIDRDRLRRFILSAQEEEHGGLSDRPGDVADIHHTCFGLTGLSLIGKDGLAEIDPRYCMPLAVTKKLGL
ncbi:Type-2 proteins geranylgeranyltransferase subunit beta [Taphrina deformans PYCC 5710]|uniref:Geranylgeranyl transferase type-2 subunit beta n=1 Tax=Taphrina deformans (strain PYCC 5710 / ATCC 11124 / CBS 356.35 / IMI 108563 / JCM 9778 / NBRC 8474) TaxID=1097556 RepID=R4XBT0_TAPDE|nr:Type-2 proteins geranylgeranyltransferase subunit beta [Taphrina deformans PYCC 5710]|eukprot:CCG83254.1 Type-2 proteins geranylgeranyltransferase subunit beta [Taphrina deformans PYCC 5710]